MATEAPTAAPIRGRFARMMRRGGRDGWDPDEVAGHLMARRAGIMRGLARSSPWAGIDEDTRASYYGSAAATIARIAATGEREDWQTFADLERAQITAYRHESLDHWKRLNAASRRGDKSAVEFDADRHITGVAPLDKLFEQPDVIAVQRDLLADLTDENLRAFWTTVFEEQVTFKEAGDRLGMTKSGVMVATKSGRKLFAGHLHRRASGELCRSRGLDIKALNSGDASATQRERAEAHLEGCYACALVHEPRTSALDRGLLGLAPTGLILRLLSRAGDAASVPALRVAESGTVGRAAAAGVAALAVAGAGVGVKAELAPSHSERKPPIETTVRAPTTARVFRPVDPPAPPTATLGSGSAAARRSQTQATKAAATAMKRKRQRAAQTEFAAPVAPSPVRPAASAPPEFEIEQTGPAAPAPSSPTPTAPPKASSPAQLEFPTP